MGLQSIIEKSEFTNFLQCGAILQLEPDQFKLIWGPFHALTINVADLEDEITIIYKPDFWDFICEDKVSTSAVKGTQEKTLTRAQLLTCLRLMADSSPHMTWDEPEVLHFKKQFDWSQKQFHLGTLIKTVPIQIQTGVGAYTISNLVYSLIVLTEAEHFGTTYGYWNCGQGFLGQTPEKIISWNAHSRMVSTMALAGTMAEQNGVEKLIQEDVKILHEHDIVVEDLKLALTKVKSIDCLEIQKREMMQLKYLVHLLTPISVKNVVLKDTLALTEAIHPSAALGLFPRTLEKFKQWSQFEIQKDRKNFAAPFGFFQKQKVHVIAAIRSFYFTESAIQIYSGCGVTVESQLEAELLELQMKRDAVKKMMGLNL